MEAIDCESGYAKDGNASSRESRVDDEYGTRPHTSRGTFDRHDGGHDRHLAGASHLAGHDRVIGNGIAIAIEVEKSVVDYSPENGVLCSIVWFDG